MTIDAIAPLTADTLPALADSIAPTPAAGADFAPLLAQLDAVSSQINGAQTQLTQLATGASGDLHNVMLELTRARLAFELTLQVRNKVLEGYQDIMRMQL